MSIFNEYLTGYERELAIEASAFDTEMSKLFTMLEMVELQYNQMVKDAELKVLTESGTYDDLAYLITEAEAEAGKQQQGIFATIINAILGLFTKIGDGIKKLLGMGDDNIDVEVPANTEEKHKEISGCIAKIQDGVKDIRGGNWSGAVKILEGIKIPALLVAGTAGAVGATVAIKKGKLNTMINGVSGQVNKLRTTLQEIQKKSSEGNTIGDKIKSDAISFGLKAVEKLSQVILNFTGTLSSLITKAIEKGKGVVNKITGKGEPQPEQTADGADETPEVADESDKKKKIKVIMKPTKINYVQWKLLSNGKALWYDAPNNKWKLADNAHPIPKEIARVIKNAQSRGLIVEEGFDLEAIREELGENYLIESAEDGIIITSLLEDGIEQYTESTSRSIFGYSLENEEVFQESDDVFEQELVELSNILASL